MKNSNLLIAVVVCMVFVIGWDSLVVSRFKSKTPPPSASTQKAVIASESTSVPKNETTVDRARSLPAEAKGEGGLPRNDNTPKSIVLKAAGVEVEVQSNGAAVSKWNVQEEDGNWVELVGKPVLETFPDTNASVTRLSESAARLTYNHPDGVRITKTLTLLNEPPFHTLEIAVTNTGGQPKEINIPLLWTGGLHKHLSGADPKSRDADATRAEMRIVAYQGRAQTWKSGFFMDRTINRDIPGPFEWVGTDNHHFLAALLQRGGAIAALHVDADRDNPPSFTLPLQFQLAGGETKTQTFHLYVGPKKLRTLAKSGHNLDAAVDFGTFGIISKALLRTLEFFRKQTNNYGWAIVLLTIAIQILVFPLTRKSLSHSVRMKDLQPQIKQLQTQFKEDPKRMQIEMFNLYRKNGMKFMGMEGCFPILLQLPIFFAFYTTLNVAYELRGASWLWIPDLGLHDPKYILPVLMGVGMFAQQKMTTVSADPAQARMMMFMPVIMVFMFWKLPAGLVLYWSVNSLCTILIQKILQWRQHAAPKRA